MTIRTILLPLFGDDADAPLLAAATEFAGRMQAHVVALYCVSDPTNALHPVPQWQSATMFSDAFIKRVQENAASQREQVERTYAEWRARPATWLAFGSARPHAASAELVIAAGKPKDIVREHAVASDLVVTSLARTASPERSRLLTFALFEARRPVLALPAPSDPSLFAAPVAIGWNYSPEAARALDAALPIVESVGEAAVLMAGRHQDDDAGRRVAGNLGRHGVKSRVLKLGNGGRPIDLIAAAVRELGAGLLVMGANSHTRAHEFVFGGMTGYMLERAPVPLLLAH